MDRVATDPLASLAVELDVSADALEAALAELDEGGAITRTPAWPEIVRRIVAGGSLRETARRFQTSPRRIRRGLARSAVRVGGVDVPEDGIPELHAVAEELGQVPDGELAERCGVTVEAVQGERRRRGIDAFRPMPSPQRKVARRRGAPMPPPKPRTKARKVWQQDEVDTQVVTRVARRRGPPERTSAPPVSGFATGLQLPTPRPAPQGSFGAGERGWASASPSGAPEDSRGSRRKVRRRVIRSDADPIAAALGHTAKAVEPASAPPARRTTRRRRVARSTAASSESPEPSPASEPAPSALPRAIQAPKRSRAAAPTRQGAGAIAVRSETPAPSPTSAPRMEAPVTHDVPDSTEVPKVAAPVASRPLVPSLSSPSGRSRRASRATSSLRGGALPAVRAVSVPSVPRVVSATAPALPLRASVPSPAAPAPTPAPAAPVAEPAAVASTPVESDPLQVVAAKVRTVPAPAEKAPQPSLEAVEPPANPVQRQPPEVVASPPAAPPARPIPSMGPPDLLMAADALDRLTGGATVIPGPGLRQTSDGLHGAEVPDIWRVRVGDQTLPLVVLAHSMVEAIVAVQPRLRPDQLQQMSVWSDGRVSAVAP